MTTTIKVPNELRDRLKAQAAEHGRTLGQHLAALADHEDREARFARLRRQMAATSPEDLASYREEVRWWDAASAPFAADDEDFSDWPRHADD